MEFEIEFYEDANGNSPVREFLAELSRRQRPLYAVTLTGLELLRDSTNHGEPLTKPVGDGLFEVRRGRKDISRVLWFFIVGRKIVLVHGFVKKTDDLPDNHREVALRRKADYLRRHPR